MKMQIHEIAVPKINLFLDVVGRRADGYHDIETVFLPLSGPVDTIWIEATPGVGLRVTCADPRVPDGEANLCWKAAKVFAEAIDMEPSWHIAVEKRIPVAAGLGGGSADAAAVLRGLNRLTGSGLADADLRRRAAGLGADVPFFVAPCPALGTGIGQNLQPIACAVEGIVVIANPGFPLTAAWAYTHLAKSADACAPSLRSLTAALAAGTLDTVAECTFNALEVAILDTFPLVDMLRASLVAGGCLAAHVSGSGPTVYGLCRPGAGAAVVTALQEQYGQAVETFACPIPTGTSLSMGAGTSSPDA